MLMELKVVWQMGKYYIEVYHGILLARIQRDLKDEPLLLKRNERLLQTVRVKAEPLLNEAQQMEAAHYFILVKKSIASAIVEGDTMSYQVLLSAIYQLSGHWGDEK